MSDYGYLDQYGILHIVDTEATAKKYASGKVVKTDVPNEGGYPVVPGKDDHIIVYTKEKNFKVNGVSNPIEKLGTMYPAVDALVKQLL